MLEGGEEPRFIARRLIIFASEDVGNADPRGLLMATAAAEAFDRIGLPEGGLILAQATSYLACAEKSNACDRGLGAAVAAVREHGGLPVPLHLRNAPTALLKELGHGKAYRSPHDQPSHFVAEQYLPDALSQAVFYAPSEAGEEAEIAQRQRARWGAAKRPKRD